jgi:predicted nucleic acid-binding Zn ribbon protein
MPAKPKVDAGWLQLQRERYGAGYRYIPPDKICTAGDLIPGLMKKMGLEAESRLSEIEKVWPELAGKANAAHARPGRWEKGLLVVYVDHHVWLNELKKFASATLLKKLHERFGKTAVRQLRFEMDPDA